jgi:nucleoside-diphosphate-sugar epimerase
MSVRKTDAVVRACREAGVRKLVFTSSMTVVYEPSTPYKLQNMSDQDRLLANTSP